MEENINTSQPVTPPMATPIKKGFNFTPFILVGLIVVIGGLASSILFLDQIKGLLDKKPIPITDSREQSAILSPTPGVICKRFTDLTEALNNIEIACVLDLSNQNLNTLPKNITKLIKLNEIVLNNNSFTQFPEILTEIDTLTYIDLSNNQIASVPPLISKLNLLQNLNLSNNKLTSFPTEIKTFSSLNNLILNGNQFSIEEQERIKSNMPQAKPGFDSPQVSF